MDDGGGNGGGSFKIKRGSSMDLRVGLLLDRILESIVARATVRTLKHLKNLTRHFKT